MRLPQPLHGATAAPSGEGLLVIGGADRSDVSLDEVLLLDPRANRVSRAGALTTPLHDAAAATVRDRTLVFGGGASTTYDTVQELVAGGSAREIGHLPVGASDLSAVTSGGGVVYVLGGTTGSGRSHPCIERAMDAASRKWPSCRPPCATRRLRRSAGGSTPSVGSWKRADTDEIQEYDAATGANLSGRPPAPGRGPRLRPRPQRRRLRAWWSPEWGGE